MTTITLSPANFKPIPTLASGGPTIAAIVIDPNQAPPVNVGEPVPAIDQAIADIAAASQPGHTALPPPNNFHFFDGTVAVSGDVPGDAFTGKTPGVTAQFIDLTPDNIGITGLKPNLLMMTATGNDAQAAQGGTNILSGGSGTDTFVGGTGAGSQDTFLSDLSGGKTDTTIFNFHTGDNAAIVGVEPTDFTLSFADTTLGLVLTAAPITPGHNGATLTLNGYSTADIGSKLSFGLDESASTPYLFVHAN
jgi:hypothetical protein